MIARVACALAVLAIVAVGVTLARYEQARGSWQSHSATIGTSGYDAAASDTAYRDVETALVWVERSARVAAACVVVAGIASGRARPRRKRASGTRVRRVTARIVDLATLMLVFAANRARAPSPGATVVIDWVLPALVAALVLGLAANGASIGDRALALVER